MVAEHDAKRLVQEVRVAEWLSIAATARMIDGELRRLAECDLARGDLDDMGEDVAELLLDVGDLGLEAIADDRAGVADLAAGLAVERRLVEDGEAGLALFRASTSALSRISAVTTPSALSVS